MNEQDIYSGFCRVMQSMKICPRCPVTAAVSGGPDSMALTHLLIRWRLEHGVTVPLHAVTVDHGLRSGSAAEARQVGDWIKDWPGVQHAILTWEGDKPQSRVMEEARNMRRNLLVQYAHKHNIKAIFMAHHKDDQAETFLMRLASGSGLDGLAAMKAMREFDGIRFVRPLLAFKKADLIAYCAQNHVPYTDDPSNFNAEYLRPRIRVSVQALEKEGLTSERLSVTAARLGRARAALDYYTECAFQDVFLSHNNVIITYDFAQYAHLPDEIQLRLLLRAFDALLPEREYRPRLEKVEQIAADLTASEPFRKRTLGGLVFSVRRRGVEICIEKEKKD